MINTDDLTTAPVEVRRDGDRITWLCSSCGHPIPAGPFPATGCIGVDDATAIRQELAAQERDRREGYDRTEHGRQLTHWTGQARVRWQAWHYACHPAWRDSCCWIHVGRIDTLARLLYWSGLFGDAYWIHETDWAELLQRIGEWA